MSLLNSDLARSRNLVDCQALRAPTHACSWRDDRTAVIGYLLLPLRFRYGAAWLTILTIILL
jgi:hypothetical protein